MSYTKIIGRIKTSISDGHNVISGEYDKLLKSVESDLKELVGWSS